ncbi:hypothetical protein [Mesorhizobium huakuii]|uniref:Uncharacterized protein n=1 Tax=Mesorhizobium huakuii TaxID=28104 RepID=A0A7G6SQ25_9HYPH|nr:hypothetical protein [Mesorhizobium huakuii]QND56607.1 hypothetical protein HB778_08275 [Mesorhizobium huakuii]
MFHFRFRNLDIIKSLLKPYSSKTAVRSDSKSEHAEYTNVPEFDETVEPQLAIPLSDQATGPLSAPDNKNEASEAASFRNLEVPEAHRIFDDQFTVPPLDLISGPLPAPDRREKSDTYSGVVVQLNEKWRVIVCEDRIQWILQFRKGSFHGRPAWRGTSYCRAKAGLYRAIREKVGDISPGVEAQLAQLPDWVES